MSESNGTNGAAAVSDKETAENAIRSVANVIPGDKPFSVPDELAKKLASARKKIEAVGKNGSNNDQNYKYVRAEDVVKAAGEALRNAEVIVMAPQLGEVNFEGLNSRGGASGKFVTAEFIFRVVDGETGKGFETRRIGTATDYPGDKAIYKAETGATKYFLAGLLQIPLGDGSEDPESTVHGGGGAVTSGDTSPASDKQKKLFKDLMAKQSAMPKPAKKAIIEFVGGTSPKKGAISHAIDQLMNQPDPLEFAKECGWDGTVEQETNESTSNPEDGQTEGMTLPEAEAEALVEFCRSKKTKRGEILVMLRSLGVDLPPDDEITDHHVLAGVKAIPVAQVARFKQMVMAAAESKQAAAEAEQPTADSAATADATSETDVDPASPLGRAIEKIGGLGYKSEINNLTWLMFDQEAPNDLTEENLNQLVATLERANRIGIQRSSVATLIRKARETDSDVETRNERFQAWITQREENAADTQAANDAHNAAEASQQ